MRNTKLMMCCVIIICSLILFSSIPASAKFINTFLCRIGGNKLNSSDAGKMAKYDVILANRFHYDDIGDNSWSAIKAINPNVEIYLYTAINHVRPSSDSSSIKFLNNLGRYTNDRGHSAGNLHFDNSDLFLLNSSGNRIQSSTSNNYYWLDFGSTAFQNYSSEATVNDFLNQPWQADGVYSDLCFATKISVTTTPTKYNTNSKWYSAMNSMMNATTLKLNSIGQKFAANRGPTHASNAAVAAWKALDNMPNPPDVVLEEGAFAVRYGNGSIQFYPEEFWKRQIDVLSSIKNSKVLFMASTELAPGNSGTDSWGDTFTFWDGLWYALGSYLIGKNDTKNNSYFNFHHGNYNNINLYFEEYDKIDLGEALSSYTVTNYGGTNVYWREYSNGYVYVNPTHNAVTSISLPELCKRRTHSNLGTTLNNLPNINAINLKAHRAALLYKSSPGGSSVPPPTDLSIE